jgi:hypothetical protein
MRWPLLNIAVLVAACGGEVGGTLATIQREPPLQGPAAANVDAGTAVEVADAGPAAQTADAGSGASALAPIFPPDNPWNTRIDSEPVAPDSDAFIADMGADDPLMAGWDKYGDGIPYIEVPADQAMVQVNFWGYPQESDPGPYPIPWGAPIDPGGDHHVIVVDRGRGFLYELFLGSRNSDGSWSASNGAKWNLNSNALRPLRWSSADAAGLPIFPGLVRWDEVNAGWIGHALRFVVGHSQKGFVWPARHASGTCPLGSSCPPMGLRVRLKSSVDLSGFSWRMKVILIALQKYGMFVADNGGGTSWWLSGAPDPRFTDADLLSLKQIKGHDFEVVQHGAIMPQ